MAGEQQEHNITKQKNISLEQVLSLLKNQVDSLEKSLGEIAIERDQTLDENKNLLLQLQKINQKLDEFKQNLDDQEAQTQALQTRFHQTLALKAAELEQLNAQLEALQTRHEALTHEQKKNAASNRMGQYRSEFFAKLQQIIGERSDIRVVGDRFIFQSEVLFDKASAELGAEGKKKLDQLIKVLKEITEKIPKDLNWVLRVDGHTDQLPIKTSQFPSNWELSSARAISVVKYMTDKGIDAHHLVAAGFGQYHPLNRQTTDEKELARNRRIEFKLDQR